MNARTRRTGAMLAGAVIIGGSLLAPTAAHAAPVRAEAETPGACQVTGGDFSWGVKESFRAYISGSIANGSWEASDGATYATPDFTWGSGTGSIDPATGEGSISFTGTVHFTGHDGVLDLTLANPTLEFEGDGKAALLLDARSTDMEGKVAIDTKQEWVGDVVVPDQLPVSDNTLTAADLPTTLTNSGAKAFAGFYEGGIELDPISITTQFASCSDNAGTPAAGSASGESDAAEPTAEAQPISAPVSDTPRIPWLPIAIGGVAILVIGITGGLLLAGRKPKPAGGATPQNGAADPAPQSPAPAAESDASRPAPSGDASERLFGEDR